VLHYKAPLTGVLSWDVHDYFTEKTFQIMGESYSFWEESFTSFRSFIEPVCVSHGIGAPTDYRIVLGDHGLSNFGLSYGWPEWTFHQSHRWSLGKWRQDLTERGAWYHELDIYEDRQFTSLDEICRDIEKELARVIARWEYFQRTGHYPLQWSEVASLMVSIRRGWDSRDMQCTYDQNEFRLYLSGQRGGSFQLQLVAEGRSERPLWVTASRGDQGWRFDVFAPYTAMGTCPWYETLVIDWDYQSDRASLRCPLPHKTPHLVRATAIRPWELKQEILETHVHNAIADTPSLPYRSSFDW